jgi:hypothetical protein
MAGSAPCHLELLHDNSCLTRAHHFLLLPPVPSRAGLAKKFSMEQIDASRWPPDATLNGHVRRRFFLLRFLFFCRWTSHTSCSRELHCTCDSPSCLPRNCIPVQLNGTCSPNIGRSFEKVLLLCNSASISCCIKNNLNCYALTLATEEMRQYMQLDRIKVLHHHGRRHDALVQERQRLLA